MNPREAFKVGFLARCVEEGVPPEQIPGHVKQAMEKLAILKDLLHAATSIGGTGLQLGTPLLLAAPPILGGLAGYGMAKATDIDDTDVDEIKKRELIEEYQRQTDRLKRERTTRDFRKHLNAGRVFPSG